MIKVTDKMDKLIRKTFFFNKKKSYTFPWDLHRGVPLSRDKFSDSNSAPAVGSILGLGPLLSSKLKFAQCMRSQFPGARVRCSSPRDKESKPKIAYHINLPNPTVKYRLDLKKKKKYIYIYIYIRIRFILNFYIYFN